MDDLKRMMEAEPPDGLDRSNVFPLFDPASRRTPFPTARGTSEEIAEYRRIRPMLVLLAERAPELMAMMREWQVMKGPDGCPVMSSILPPD